MLVLLLLMLLLLLLLLLRLLFLRPLVRVCAESVPFASACAFFFALATDSITMSRATAFMRSHC